MTTSLVITNGPRQGLPRTVPLFQDESIESFVSRLAHANHVDVDQMRRYLSGERKAKGRIALDALSIASRKPPSSLFYALPELHATQGTSVAFSAGDELRPACRSCTATKRILESVMCYARPGRNVCLRHQKWIGPGVSVDQVNLTNLPEVIRAQKRHRFLNRRLGRRNVRYALEEAAQIVDHWCEHEVYAAIRRDRYEAARGPAWHVEFDDSLHHAASYPEIIALTSLLASPTWRKLACSLDITDYHRFRDEVRARVLPAFNPAEGFQPLKLWRRAELGRIATTGKNALEALPPTMAGTGDFSSTSRFSEKHKPIRR